MEHIKQLSQIENRAKQLGSSLGNVSLRAGLWPDQVSRWRNGTVIPKVTTYANAVRRLEAVLDRIEAETKSPPA